MKEVKEQIDKVVEFAQSKSRATQFLHDYPITEELKIVILTEEFRSFADYVVNRYFSEYQILLQEYIEEHSPEEAKHGTLKDNLFWWKVLYDSSQDDKMSFVEDYIAENIDRLKSNPLIISWLREWEKAVPKFYHVGYKYSDRVLIVTDMLTTKTLDVIVYDPTAVPPQKGEIVMGTLIPIGDALYFPIIDFYHFEYTAREDIALSFHHNFRNRIKDNPHEEFIHAASVMLQIERLISLENQKDISPE